MAVQKSPTILCILDGWGQRDHADDNAITQARTPNWDRWCQSYPHNCLRTDGQAVGLPEGQMGNSEVGHMNIGAGRIITPESGKIDCLLSDQRSLLDNKVIENLVNTLKKSKGRCHLMGLLSPGGIHSHQDQILQWCRFLDAYKIPTCVHIFTDGRDTPPASAKEYIAWFEDKIVDLPCVQIVTVGGRFWAMDRDKRWERVTKAAACMVHAQAQNHFETALQAVEFAYESGETDEFITPMVIGDYQGMQPGDGLLMTNFRSDRVRQILQLLLDKLPTDEELRNQWSVPLAATAGAVSYGSELDSVIAPIVHPEIPQMTLGEVVSHAGKQQFRIAETEKYAHVTFFLNGGREAVFTGEERQMIASPKVTTYDLKPQMSCAQVTDALIDAIDSQKYDLLIVNYANADMVGHTGNLVAVIKAIQAVDEQLGRLEAVISRHKGMMLVTADHGNAERMRDEKTRQPHTQHTTDPVPVVFIDKRDNPENLFFTENGKLADIAPTILSLLGIKQPDVMTGKNLLLCGE